MNRRDMLGMVPMAAAALAMVTRKTKCDGNHAMPMCDDPECWHTPQPKWETATDPTPRHDVTPRGRLGERSLAGHLHVTDCSPEAAEVLSAAFDSGDTLLVDILDLTEPLSMKVIGLENSFGERGCCTEFHLVSRCHVLATMTFEVQA